MQKLLIQRYLLLIMVAGTGALSGCNGPEVMQRTNKLADAAPPLLLQKEEGKKEVTLEAILANQEVGRCRPAKEVPIEKVTASVEAKDSLRVPNAKIFEERSEVIDQQAPTASNLTNAAPSTNQARKAGSGVKVKRQANPQEPTSEKAKRMSARISQRVVQGAGYLAKQVIPTPSWMEDTSKPGIPSPQRAKTLEREKTTGKRPKVQRANTAPASKAPALADAPGTIGNTLTAAGSLVAANADNLVDILTEELDEFAPAIIDGTKQAASGAVELVQELLQ